LCGHCEIDNKTIDQSASYIEHWLARLKEDRKLVVHAAAQAQKACDFILNVERKEDEGPTEHQPKEFEVVALRECPVPEQMKICDTPDAAADCWRLHVATNPYFDSERECFWVFGATTRSMETAETSTATAGLIWRSITARRQLRIRSTCFWGPATDPS